MYVLSSLAKIIRDDININNNHSNDNSDLTLLALASTTSSQRSITASESDLTTNTRGHGRTRRPLTPNLSRRKKTAFDWKNTLVTPDTMTSNHKFKITINNEDINVIKDQNADVLSRKRVNSF